MSEHADVTAVRHRDDDPAGSDFRASRHVEEREVIIKHTSSNRVLITIGSAVITLLIGLVAFFGARDRASIDENVGSNTSSIQRIDSRVGTHDAQILVMQAGIAEINKKLEAQDKTMQQILAEVRKK